MDVFEKISVQQKGKENTAAWMVGEQLKDICRADPVCADLVDKDLDVPEMSIDKAERKIKEYADKQKRTGNCVCVPPNKAEEIIRQFYGLPAAGEKPVPKSKPILDLKSFL